MDISHGLFSADDFANRVAASLGDERVSSFVADKITDVVIAQRPDLTAVRPLLVGTADGLVGSAPFRAVARTALKSAHRAFFSRTGEDVPAGGARRRRPGPERPRRHESGDWRPRSRSASRRCVAKLPREQAGEHGGDGPADPDAGRVAAARPLSPEPRLLLGGILAHPQRREGLMRAGVGLVVRGAAARAHYPGGAAGGAARDA